MTIKVNMFEAYRNAVMRNPDASRKEAFGYFLTEMQRDPQYLVKLAEYYFDHQYANWQPTASGKGSTTLAATPTQQRRQEKIAARREEGKKLVAKEVERQRSVLLMNLQLPNGKRLRDATGAECAKAGGFYTEVSRHLKGSEVVGKQLEEKELQNIYSRFEKPKSTRRGREHRDEERISP